MFHKMAYFGSEGQILNFFQRLNLRCETYINPAEFICESALFMTVNIARMPITYLLYSIIHIFTTPFGHNISSSGILYQQYADDTEIFLHLTYLIILSEKLRVMYLYLRGSNPCACMRPIGQFKLSCFSQHTTERGFEVNGIRSDFCIIEIVSFI